MSTTKSKMFADLPPEILIQIFIDLPIKDGVQLASACKNCYEVFQVEIIWETKILMEYGINVRRPKEIKCKSEMPVTAQDFYKHILYKYGQLLGTWQRKSFGYYGSIFQVVYDEWCLKILEWYPPAPKSDIQSGLKTSEFMRISMTTSQEDNDKVKLQLLDKITFKNDERSNIKGIVDMTRKFCHKSRTKNSSNDHE